MISKIEDLKTHHFSFFLSVLKHVDFGEWNGLVHWDNLTRESLVLLSEK